MTQTDYVHVCTFLFTMEGIDKVSELRVYFFSLADRRADRFYVSTAHTCCSIFPHILSADLISTLERSFQRRGLSYASSGVTFDPRARPHHIRALRFRGD